MPKNEEIVLRRRNERNTAKKMQERHGGDNTKKNRAQDRRRAKIKMPDGSVIDIWVPKTAGFVAVYDAALERWQKRRDRRTLV